MVRECINPNYRVPLGERFATMHQFPKHKRSLLVYKNQDTSTFRYRVYNICQALNLSMCWKATYCFVDEIETVVKMLEKMDLHLIVVSRVMWSRELEFLFAFAHRCGIPIVFDVDDLVFDPKYIPLILHTLCKPAEFPLVYDYWFSYIARLNLTASQCDAAIASNAYLEKKLKESLNKNSYIIPNFMNEHQLVLSSRLFEERRMRASKRFRIGYYPGSPSHQNDFESIISQVNDLLHETTLIELHVIGFLEFPSCFNKFLANGQLIYTPLVDFLNLQREISIADINIVPLVINDFTNCKSNLKFFEAAVVGTITCATPIASYAEHIQDKCSGYLCEQNNWYDTLRTLFEEGIEESMIIQAREYCLNNYSPDKVCRLIESVYDNIISECS